MKPLKLFHISEDPSIKIFFPRPSPTSYSQIKGDVVFAMTDYFLHNYFFPRDCPRIAFYKKEATTKQDEAYFLGQTNSKFVLTTESSWYPIIKKTSLYCYEFPGDTFSLLDEGAGYYISYESVIPSNIIKIDDLIFELTTRNVELRFTSNLWKLADLLDFSTLGFSMIRMRNASPKIE